jgi:outer membrane protein assembly factor BamB
VPRRIVVTDSEHPDESRILVGGDLLSDQSTLRILKPNGALVSELPVEGWTSMLTALAVGKGEGSRLIACEASRGENLHLFSLNENEWERRWLKRLGGQVTGLHVREEEDLLLAGTSQGFLLCYDLDGTLLWHWLFDRGIQHGVEFEDDVLVVDQSGGLKSVNASGDVAEMGGLGVPCSHAVSDGARVTLRVGPGYSESRRWNGGRSCESRFG